MLKEALSGARMWEIRFGAADKSRHEYRDNAKKLVTQNESLQNAVNQVSISGSTLNSIPSVAGCIMQ